MPELFDHQQKTRDFVLERPAALVFSDPGTGKTAAMLAVLQALKAQGETGRTLVLAPKSILESAWCDDCRTFTPGLSIAAAYAENRAEAFALGTDIVVTNHDAIKWLAQRPALLDEFATLIVDESTAYKNPTSQRSKALAKLAPRFTRRIMLTGTPMPNGLIDIWHQVYLADLGERLGAHYYKFRAVTHDPVDNGIRVDWAEKNGARDTVTDMIADITIRYALRECLDVPKNFIPAPRNVELNKKLRAHYDAMVKEAALLLDNGKVDAVNAAVLRNKLLQIASGAVYDAAGNYHLLDDTRYQLVADMIEARDHTLCAFLWRHQRDGILAALKQRGITRVAVIDGTVAGKERTQLVRRFQQGDYQAMLAHPQSAGHGLTLTRANTAIWPSPTYNAEHYHQFNARIDRASQQRETETVRIEARNTVEALVYDALQHKLDGQVGMLDLVQALRLV